jgi:hypothetical protein
VITVGDTTAADALLETMEIMANPEAMKAIRRDQSGKGKYLPLSVLDED